MNNYVLSWDNHTLDLGKRTHIMGILNITPDSFSDGGKFFDPAAALDQAEKMVEQGADIIDIGGESTRPFSEPVPSDEEIRRVVPVIEKLASKLSIPISIDTSKSEVAKKALDAGASIINDIYALRRDPEMGKVASRYKVPVILMHMKGTPENMQVKPEYENLMGEIYSFFEKIIDNAVKKGIPKSNIIIDPGIGFGKTIYHNLCLINNIDKFHPLGVPVLVGSSRKFFIRQLLKNKDQKDMNPLDPAVETGTQASVAAAVLRGAHIVRVHNVANTVSTIKITDAIKAAKVK